MTLFCCHNTLTRAQADEDDGEAPSAKRAKPDVVVDAALVKSHFAAKTVHSSMKRQSFRSNVTQLGKLTVPVLKEFCKLVQIRPKTKKEELIAQVEAHFAAHP